MQRNRTARWKAKRETDRLHHHAERYAEMAFEIAEATVDAAERTALETWLARKDAISAQIVQETRP